MPRFTNRQLCHSEGRGRNYIASSGRGRSARVTYIQYVCLYSCMYVCMYVVFQRVSQSQTHSLSQLSRTESYSTWQHMYLGSATNILSPHTQPWVD